MIWIGKGRRSTPKCLPFLLHLLEPSTLGTSILVKRNNRVEETVLLTVIHRFGIFARTGVMQLKCIPLNKIPLLVPVYPSNSTFL